MCMPAVDCKVPHLKAPLYVLHCHIYKSLNVIATSVVSISMTGLTQSYGLLHNLKLSQYYFTILCVPICILRYTQDFVNCLLDLISFFRFFLSMSSVCSISSQILCMTEVESQRLANDRTQASLLAAYFFLAIVMFSNVCY